MEFICSGEIVEIKLTGNLDYNKAQEAEDYINNQITGGKKLFVIELGGVNYLSSSGLRVFVSTLRRLKDLKGRMVLANLSMAVVRTLDAVQLNSFFDVVQDTAEAMRVLEGE
jgi:anti-sigma B factor antagonist